MTLCAESRYSLWWVLIIYENDQLVKDLDNPYPEQELVCMVDLHFDRKIEKSEKIVEKHGDIAFERINAP